jgi:lysophospholipase L1-like esterase
VVPSFYSEAIFEALLKTGVEPRFSLYKKVGHDSWTNAFAEPDLFDWLYSHQKEGETKVKEEDVCTPEWLKFSEASLLGKYKDANTKQKTKDNSQSTVFMGDSITEGWLGTSPDFWTAHPTFINRGTGGHTTSQMLVRFRQDVINLQPKTVVIFAGTNDIAGNTGETSLETIANNIYTMADLAQKHNIKVIIASVLPAYDYPWKPGLEPAGKIIRLNGMLEAFAKANNHSYLDFHTQMADNRNGLQDAYTYDMVHCTAQGYQKMEEILTEFLRLN